MRFSAPLYLFDHKDSSLKVVPLRSDPFYFFLLFSLFMFFLWRKRGLPSEHNPQHLGDRVLAWCRERHIEPPSNQSAVRTHESGFFEVTCRQLSPETRTRLDALWPIGRSSRRSLGSRPTAAVAGSGSPVMRCPSMGWYAEVCRTSSSGVSPSWGRAPYLGRSYRIIG
jgi:hypothetical protein